MERIFEKLDRYFCRKWRLAVLDMDRGRWIVKPETSNIPYLKAENANGRHILIQPDSTLDPYYLLVDDVGWTLIQRQHQFKNGVWKPGRMVVETSRRNYQVWIHSSRHLSLKEKRYWLKKLHSDPGADPNNRWGRCPGFRNRKHKHRRSTGGYPLSRLIWIDWRYRAEIPDTHINTSDSELKRLSPQPPEGGVCRRQDITRANYTRGDESATDFAYAIALFRRGYTTQFVRGCILSERSDWKNHIGERRKSHYLNRTIERAKIIVDRS
jgi:hypothetical protein